MLGLHRLIAARGLEKRAAGLPAVEPDSARVRLRRHVVERRGSPHPPFRYYPTYNRNAAAGRVENFAASIATMGEDGWGTWPARCTAAPPNDPPLDTCPAGTDYYVDDTLRDAGGVSYGTFARFMSYATELDPIFLLINQNNEFAQPDEGWNAETTDDIEPQDDGIGTRAVAAVRAEIMQYRKKTAPIRRPRDAAGRCGDSPRAGVT
jgi:hypothetical protein